MLCAQHFLIRLHSSGYTAVTSTKSILFSAFVTLSSFPPSLSSPSTREYSPLHVTVSCSMLPPAQALLLSYSRASSQSLLPALMSHAQTGIII